MPVLTELTIDEKAICYELLLYYYRGDLLNRTFEEWQKIINLLKKHKSMAHHVQIREAVSLLENIEKEDLEQFEYHFNRLFIGPGKLQAPPYESSYRNFEKMTMQQETMKVRNFYYFGGLQVAEEGKVPDDHIKYELEFILYLLASDNPEHHSLYKMFLERHFLVWCSQHCEDILNHSPNRIARAFAFLLQGLAQLEKRMIEGGE